MGSSRWSLLVMFACLLTVAASQAYAGFPFINGFEPIEMEDDWTGVDFWNIVVDDSNRVTVFWCAVAGDPFYVTLRQFYYRRFDFSGNPLSENAPISREEYQVVSAIFPGCNAQGKWAFISLTRWNSLGLFHEDRAWFSDADGVFADTGIIVGAEVDLAEGNGLGGGDVDSMGNFVIAWDNLYSAAVWCQVFDPNGEPLTDTIRVSDGTFYDPTLSYADVTSVSMTPGGDFVVAFQAECDICGPDPYSSDVFARAYYADGTPKTGIICASCYDDSLAHEWIGGVGPSIAVAANGDFALTWFQRSIFNGQRVLMRRYHANGEPKGDAVIVDIVTITLTGKPWIAGDEAGNLVVSWPYRRWSGDQQVTNLYAQRYDPDGNKVGAKYLINNGCYDASSAPVPVVMNNNGLVSFLWTGSDATGHSSIRVQLIDLEDIGAYVHGDANNDRMVNVSDAVFLISYIFSDGQPPAHVCLGDANGDGIVNISDVVTLIAYIFGGGSLTGECPQ